MNQIRRLCERVIWLDGGQIVREGPTHEVVSAYEAAMTSREWLRPERPDAPRVKARFLKWEIVEPRNDQPNVLTELGPVTIRFFVQVYEPIRLGHHGIALFSSEGQMMWGTATNDLNVTEGLHEFIYKLTTLPLRPGAYFWRVSLYDEQGLVDVWDCVPELIVATQPMGHPRDEWAGLLNIPYHFTVNGVRSRV
jgi:hypothetical protein